MTSMTVTANLFLTAQLQHKAWRWNHQGAELLPLLVPQMFFGIWPHQEAPLLRRRHLHQFLKGGKRGEFGGKNLSDGGIVLSEKGSEPSITEASVPKIILVVNDPGNQPKLTMPHQILSTIQIEAKQCRIECPDYSMSIMEDYFDKQARCTTSYLVSLTQEVKEFLLDEGEIMVPGDEHGEVRLEVKDATPDGRIIQKADEADEAVTAGPQGPTYKPKRDRKSTIVCQYRLDKPQLGKHYKSGQLDREAEFIKSKINRAFENVDFNYSVNLDQPAPMKHPINQLTAYIEIDPSVTSQDLRHVKFEHVAADGTHPPRHFGSAPT